METISISFADKELPEDQIKEALRTFMERPRQNITSMWKWGGKK